MTIFGSTRSVWLALKLSGKRWRTLFASGIDAIVLWTACVNCSPPEASVAVVEGFMKSDLSSENDLFPV